MKRREKDCLDVTVTIEQPASPMVRHGVNRKPVVAFLNAMAFGQREGARLINVIR